jgi:asparagine synthase (glutamine-hydrolysing)
MCGIAGKVWRDVRRPADGGAVRVMNAIQRHRGPDDEGTYLHGPVALGHRRLSILDLSPAGHQPMPSSDGRLVLVFNGEIYNFVEIRRELERYGRRFRSGTDTEVVLEAYRHWGADCVTRFNGMWAFAIYDLAAGRLFLSRDRFGIKPFYYLLRDDCFAFASEIKGLLAAFPEERRVNLPVVHHFMPGGMMDDGADTFFARILSLPAAHSATYDLRRGVLSTDRYWDLDREAFRARWSGDDPVEVMWDLLQSAVHLHMRSDVPVGTCLSGGVDSSTIVALMSRRLPDPVHTFSGLYPDADCDEKEYVDAVNAHTGADPCPVYPEPDTNLLDDLATITWHQDEPTGGPGLYTQFHVMRAARGTVKVILDGQGGDELFAGYLPYLTLHLHDLLDRGGLASRARALSLAVQMVRHWGVRWVGPAAPRLLGAPLARLLRWVVTRRRPPDAASVPLLHPALADQVRGAGVARAWQPRLPGRLDDTLYRQLVEQSIPALLHYEDRNSMAYSLEARVPLLDYRIVEFALSLDVAAKVKGSWTKWVLRKAASRVLPPKVAWRRSKLGYPTPFARWLRTPPHRDAARDLLFSRDCLGRELVDGTALRQVWDQHQAGADNSWLLYRCLTLELWHRMYIDRWLPQPAISPSPDTAGPRENAA